MCFSGSFYELFRFFLIASLSVFLAAVLASETAVTGGAAISGVGAISASDFCLKADLLRSEVDFSRLTTEFLSSFILIL